MPSARRWIAAALLTSTATSCGSTPSRYDAVRTQFLDRMDETETEANAILEDLKKGPDRSSILERLARIRRSLEAARGLRYRKTETENVEMDGYFDTFLLKLGQLEGAEWSAEDGVRLWDKLQFNCNVCHGQFRDE